MPKYYFGLDGSYEIYDQSSILHRKLDNNGRVSSESKIYADPKNIPSRQDRWRIEQLLRTATY
jgi:hypothetical protein